jgi:hypothetical protein
MPNSSIKDEKTYRALRDDGASKEKAARIANASANQGKKTVSKKGGKGESYEDRTKSELLQRAREIGIEGRSKMDKGELVDALRNH